MILCGIDSSTNYTAISKFVDGNLEDYVLIDRHKCRDTEQRINEMIIEIYTALSEYNPDVIYQEYVWGRRNPKTLIELSIILGAVRGWALSHSCVWQTIMPSTWRRILNLNTKASRDDIKKQTIEYVKNKYNITPETDDVADAICLGLSGVKMEEDENDC